jgi:hypothetical protein
LSLTSHSYQIDLSQFKCESIDLFHILQPHGLGIEIFLKKCRSGAKRSILALIFLNLSNSSEFIFKLEVSNSNLSQLKLCFTHIEDIISSIVITSQMFGTLFRVIFHFNNKLAARIGKQAFFDQLIFTFQDNFFHQLITNIKVNNTK